MNNLKRVLSLGLVGTMLSSMMVMGASAAFTDEEKIEHSEAVNVLVALDIVDGKPDGSFDPEGNVTRSQMAKMIAVAMNGGSEANTGTKTTPTYTDIKGHWAESYIEYCADLGIISGRGDGTFDPDANVTGLEATKMVLTAMGFDAAAYKLTGASWAVRTDEVARTMTGTGWTTGSGNTAVFHAEPGMYDGLETVMMASNASRDTAAQLIWNGLQNRTRTVQPTTNTSTGSVEWTYITNSSTLLNQRYNANVSTGIFTGNYYTGSGATAKGEITVDLGTTATPDPHHFPSDFDIANIGEEVKVIWKDGTRGTKGTLDTKDVIFGVFNTGAARVVKATLADVKDLKDNKNQVNIGGAKYETDTSVDVIVNYATNVTPPAGATVLTANGKFTVDADNNGSNAGSGTNNDITTALKFSTGDALKAVIDPNDNKIHTIYVTTSKLAAVTGVNSEKITMNNNVGAIKFADNDVEEGLEKGDVVAVTTLYKAKATDDDAYTIVKKAETVEGEVDGWKESKTVTVDGEAHKIYNDIAEFMLKGTDIPNEDNTISTFKDTGNTYIGEEVKLYMVNGYVGAAVQTSESASNYSLVTEVKNNVTGSNSVFSGLELQVMDGEGKSSIIKVHKNSPAGDLTANYKVGDIVTYTMTDDNFAKVTKEGAVDITKIGAYDDERKTFGSGDPVAVANATTLVTNDCVIFVETKKTGAGNTAEDMDAGDALLFSGAEYKVYKLRDLKSFGLGGTTSTPSKGVTVVPNKDGKIVAAFVNFQNNPNGATDNTVYGIVSSENGRIKDYYSYTVQSNGEEYTVNVDSNTKTLDKGDLVWFEKTSDDNYDVSDVHRVNAEANKATVWTKENEKTALTFFQSVALSGSSYQGVNQTTLAYEKDAPIIFVDTKNDKSEAEGSIGSFDTVTGYANAVIIMDKAMAADAKIKAVFIEVSGEENIGKGNGAGAITTTKTVSAADIKALDDGMYTLEAGTTAPDFASSKPVETLRLFKFTAKDAEAHTLTIKDASGATVYAETASGAQTVGTSYIFYVSVAGATTSAGGSVGTPMNGALAAGTYTWVVGSTSTPNLVNGSFTIAAP